MLFSIIVAFLFSTMFVFSYPTFPQYLEQFHKNYTDDEYIKREQIYNQRINNFSAITDFIPGINNMTDWTKEEIQALLTFRETSDVSSTSSRPVSSNRLGNPTSLDWRANQFITRVKDQGSCGACWAFAAVALVQSFLVQQNKTDNSIDLSQQKVLQCTPNSNCNGGWPKKALDGISKSVPYETDYRYNSSTSYSGICSAGGVDTNYQAYEYDQVSDSQLINLLQLGPVAVTISADQWQYYGSGVLTCNSNPQVNHAVLAVGYTTTSIIIKNSWGSFWGMSGYAYISRNPSRNCKIGSSAYTVIWQSKVIVSLISLLIFLGIMI